MAATGAARTIRVPPDGIFTRRSSEPILMFLINSGGWRRLSKQAAAKPTRIANKLSKRGNGSERPKQKDSGFTEFAFHPLRTLSRGSRLLRMFRNDYFFALFELSCLCMLLLAGLYSYSGSFLPATSGADRGEVTEIWLLWIAVAGVPLVTFVWWAIAAVGRRR